jgi:hypothetical protein
VRFAQRGGAWVRPDVSYIDPVRRLCSYCGLSIARRYWRPDEGEDGKVYCDPAHVPAEATYPLSQFTAHDISVSHAGPSLSAWQTQVKYLLEMQTPRAGPGRRGMGGPVCGPDRRPGGKGNRSTMD